MKACIWLLALMVTGTVSPGADTTNLVEILRRYQAELDRHEGRVPASAAPQPTAPVQPSTTSRRPASTRTSVPPAELRLRAGDRLQVEVEDEPDMSLNEGEVALDGTIQLPMVGPVPVSGMTVGEATRTIREILERDYLVDPKVRVRRLESRTWPEGPALESPPAAPAPAFPADVAPPAVSSTIFISNQVAKPGKYPWTGEELTLRRAIEMAGGATPRADLSRVSVGRVIGGELRRLEIDLERPDAARRGGALLLRPGDQIEVPAKR